MKIDPMIDHDLPPLSPGQIRDDDLRTFAVCYLRQLLVDLLQEPTPGSEQAWSIYAICDDDNEFTRLVVDYLIPEDRRDAYNQKVRDLIGGTELTPRFASQMRVAMRQPGNKL